MTEKPVKEVPAAVAEEAAEEQEEESSCCTGRNGFHYWGCIQ